MPLRVLDLRGTPPPFDAALPRPSAPGADVHDVVAEILRHVRTEGDEAVVRQTAALDRVDVSDGLRVPAGEIEKARAERRPRLSEALAGGVRPHPGLPRARGAAARRPGRRRHHGGAPHPGRRRAPASTPRAAGRATPRPSSCAPPRPGWPAWALWRCACRRPPTAGSTRPRCARRPSPGSTRCTGSAARRRSRPWPTARAACRRSTSSPARATPTWPRPSARCPESSAWRRLSPGRPRSSSWPGPDAPACVRRRRPGRAGRARARRPGLAGQLGCVPRRARLRRGGPHRGGAPAGGPTWRRPWRRRGSLPGRRAGAGAGGRQRHRARAPAADGSRGAGTGAAGPRAERRRRLHRRRGRRPAWATTSRGRTTSSRRTGPPASPRRCEPTTSASTCTRCGSRPRPCGRSGPLVITLAETEGLPAHADSVRRRLGRARRARRRARHVSAVPPIRPGPGPDRGLPLAPGRGGGAPQHQRVALRPARRLARGAAGGPGGGVVQPVPRPTGHRAAPGRGGPARRLARRGLLRQRLERGAAVPDAGVRRPRAGAPSSSSPPMPCTRHIARITGDRGGRGVARRRLPDRSRRSPRPSWRRRDPT